MTTYVPGNFQCVIHTGQKKAAENNNGSITIQKLRKHKKDHN